MSACRVSRGADGPFDVTPSTALEVVVTAIPILIALVLANLTTSCITSMLATIDSRDAAFRAQMSVLSEYMRSKSVDPKVAREVTEFYHYGHSSGSTFKQTLMSRTLPMMPAELLAKTHLHLYRTLIQKCPIFDANRLPVQAVLNLLYKLEPIIGVPGQQLLKQGERNYNLFIIERGSVHIWKDYEDSEKRVQLRTLKHADFFGERSLLGAWEKGEFGGVASASCVCYSFCDLLTLTLDQFVRTMQKAGVSGKDEIQKICKSSACKRDCRRASLVGRRNSWVIDAEELASFGRRPSQEGGLRMRKRSQFLVNAVEGSAHRGSELLQNAVASSAHRMSKASQRVTRLSCTNVLPADFRGSLRGHRLSCSHFLPGVDRDSQSRESHSRESRPSVDSNCNGDEDPSERRSFSRSDSRPHRLSCSQLLPSLPQSSAHLLRTFEQAARKDRIMPNQGQDRSMT